MQEEVENRTVNLAISTTKLTGRTLVSAFNAWKRHRAVAKTAKENAAEAKEAEAAKPPRGKQTIKSVAFLLRIRISVILSELLINTVLIMPLPEINQKFPQSIWSSLRPGMPMP